jgi:hypothetical protein
MARSNRKMRLTEAHLALLPAKIDDPGPMRLDGEGPRLTATTLQPPRP